MDDFTREVHNIHKRRFAEKCMRLIVIAVAIVFIFLLVKECNAVELIDPITDADDYTFISNNSTVVSLSPPANSYTFTGVDKTVTISIADIKGMTTEEVKNLTLFISFAASLGWISSEIVDVMGEALLPRFFKNK